MRLFITRFALENLEAVPFAWFKIANCVTLRAPMESLDKLLKSMTGRGLGKIVQRAQNMDDLAHKLRLRVEPALAGHIVAVNARDDGELVVICTSPAWASRLRYASEELLEAARAAGADVTRCRFKVDR